MSDKVRRLQQIDQSSFGREYLGTDSDYGHGSGSGPENHFHECGGAPAAGKTLGGNYRADLL